MLFQRVTGHWIYAAVVGFSTYFCAYGFRKPFRAALYSDLAIFDGKLPFKTAMAVAQLMGTFIATLIGIKYVSEVPRRGYARSIALISLVLVAQLGLIIFALIPTLELKLIGIFLTGIPFGFIWGLILTVLEGRSRSDVTLACMSAAYITASGITKDIGLSILNNIKGMNEWWMPAATGAVFLLPYLACVGLLHQIPEPTAQDKNDRVARTPMFHKHRLAYLSEYWPGLSLLFSASLCASAYREFRDVFGAELFLEMGETLDNGVFTKSELSVGVGVTITLATLGFIRGNKNGFLLYFICIATGYTLLSISFILLDIAHISSIAFMIVSGLAQYFAHVPFTSGFYERQIAFLSIRNASSSFPLQINGVLGCVSTITCLVLQSLLAGHVNFVEFFRVFSYFMSGFGVLTTVGAAIYFIWYKGGTTKRVLDVLEQEDTETPKKYVFPK